jgi:hypothetical protein
LGFAQKRISVVRAIASKATTSRMAVVPLRFGVKFSPPTLALEHAMPDSSDQPRLLEVPLIPFLEQHNEDPASVVKALKAAFPEHFDPTVVSYKQVCIKLSWLPDTNCPQLLKLLCIMYAWCCLTGTQTGRAGVAGTAEQPTGKKHVTVIPGERLLYSLKLSFASTDVYLIHCPSLQKQQQQADKHDAWDTRRSELNEQSDVNTQHQTDLKDNAAGRTEQNKTKSSLKDLPPVFGSAVSTSYTAASSACLLKHKACMY